MARIFYPVLADPVLTAAQRPEQVTESRWHQPFSEPVRRVALTTAVIVASGAIAPVQMPPPTDKLGWRTELSQPTRLPVRASVSETFAPVFVAETVTLDKWHAPLSQPTRRITWIAGPELAEPAFVPQLSFAWFRDLAQPTYRTAEVANKPAFTAPAFVPPLSFAWFKELAQPTYRPAEVANKPAFTAPTFVPALSFAWYGDFSQPTRAKVSVAAQPSLVIVRSDVARDAWWFAPLSEPVRRKPTVQPDALNWSDFTPVSATGTATALLSDWFNQLQIPTRAIWSPTGMVFTWLPPVGEAETAPSAANILNSRLGAFGEFAWGQEIPATLATVTTMQPHGGPAFPYPRRGKELRRLGVSKGRSLRDICHEIERETAIPIPRDLDQFAGEYWGRQVDELREAIEEFAERKQELDDYRSIATEVHARALLRRLEDEEQMCAVLLLSLH